MGYQSKYTGAEIDNLLDKAGTALQSEQYKGTVTGVKINGATKNPSNGIVDLGTIITEHNTNILDLTQLNGRQTQFPISLSHVCVIASSNVSLNFLNITAEGYCRITIIRPTSCTISIPASGSRIRMINSTSTTSTYATATVSSAGVAPITLMWDQIQETWIGYIGL